MDRHRSICTQCGYTSLDRQSNGCLFGTGGSCPQCAGYLTFVSGWHVLIGDRYVDVPLERLAVYEGRLVVLVTCPEDLGRPSQPRPGWAAEEKILDELLASSKALLAALLTGKKK